MTDIATPIEQRLEALREQARQEYQRSGRRRPRRGALDDLRKATAEARQVITEAWVVSRVLRGQVARYEQLVRVDSWRDVITASIPGDELAGLALAGAELAALTGPAGLASCGHPANADGECGCSSWPERAPEAGQ